MVDHHASADDFSGVAEDPLLLALYRAYAGPAGGPAALRAALAAALRPRRVLAPYDPGAWADGPWAAHAEPDGELYDLVDAGVLPDPEAAVRRYVGLAFHVRPNTGYLVLFGCTGPVKAAVDQALVMSVPPNYYFPDAGAYLVASPVYHGKDHYD